MPQPELLDKAQKSHVTQTLDQEIDGIAKSNRVSLIAGRQPISSGSSHNRGRREGSGDRGPRSGVSRQRQTLQERRHEAQVSRDNSDDVSPG